MDVWSVGGDTEHIARHESPTMKDIVNRLLSNDLEESRSTEAENEAQESEEDTNDIPRTTTVVIYRKRWYILFVFCVLHCSARGGQ